MRGLTGGAGFPGVMVPGVQPPMPPPGYAQPNAEPVYNADPRAVGDVQRMLGGLGYDVGPPTGTYNGRIAQALRAFQRDHRLPQTGNITPPTLAVMNGAWQAQGRPMPQQRAAQADTAPRPAAEARRAENAGGPAAGQQPSFNCARASSNAEQIICASPPLARLDADLAEAFRSLRSGLDADEAARLVATQRAWLKQRDACGRQAACVQDRMASRLSELEAWPGGAIAQSAPPAGVPASDAGRSPMSAAPPAGPASASVAQATASVLERIAAPPAGLRPLAVLVREGWPVLSHPNSRDGGAFWMLVALGLQPGLIEERVGYQDTALDFANALMPPTNPYSRGGQWLGKDEFERGDNRQAFLRDQAGALRGLAPRVPFGFVFTTEFNLPQYDPARRGFVLPQWSNDLLAQMQPGKITLQPRFDWPAPFLPMEAAAARRLVERLGATPRGRERAVRLTLFLEATEAEPQSMTLSLDLRRVALYDSAVETKLHEFDAAPLRHQGPSGPHPLARLANPTAGMRPLTFATLDGLPLLDADASSKYAGLFGLIAAGAVPGFPGNDQAAFQLARGLLNDRVNKELFSVMSSGWAGEDEFARERTRNSFYSRYLPILKAAAPKPPFEFAYAKIAYAGQYDRQKGGFPISLISGGQGTNLGLDSEVSAGGLVPAASFAWPEPLWRLDFAAAERALRSLGSERRARAVGVFEASSLDPATRMLTLRLKSMSLYTQDLKTKLFDFPVTNDLVPFVSAAAPSRLSFAGPVALDALFACAKLFEAMGEQVPEASAARCWETARARDANAYAAPERLAGLAPDDAQRPFFPRAPVERSAATGAAFARWMKAYAAGLADAPVTVERHTTRDGPDGRTFYAFAEQRASSGSAAPAWLRAEGLQEDQLVPQGTAERIPIQLLLPNRASLYSATVPSAALASNPGAGLSAVSTVRVGAARQVLTDDGRPMVLVETTPVSTTVSAGATRLASRSYEDVPRLDGKSFTVAAPAAGPAPAKGPFLLDSALADLLAASALGDQLSPEALTYLVTRRWRYENGEGATTISDGRGGGWRYASAAATSLSARFFTPGKRRPTPEEAADLGRAFVAWAKSQAPALPVQVVVPGRLEVKKDQRTASWGSLACFGGGFSDLMGESNAAQAAYSELRSCERDRQSASEGRISWGPEAEKRCAATEARQSTLDFLKPLGGPCRLGGGALSFADPAKFSMRIPYALQTPDLPVLGDKRELGLESTLDITRVELARQPPRVADMLPEAMRRPDAGARGTGEFVTFDAALVETRWRDPNGKELARLAPDPAASLAGIVRRFEERARSADAPATPAGPYGPDLVGVQLGMGFDEAERIVRAHMAVGRVLDGKRAHDEAAKLGRIKPLTSGRLFISEDGRELIALLNDAPGAPGRVLAAWRRLYLPADSVDPADVLAGLGEKYGEPSDRTRLRTGIQLPWFGIKGGSCTSMYKATSALPLAETWYEDGTSAPYRSENAETPRGPQLPSTLLDPLSESNKRWTGCGPFMTATFLEARDARGRLHELDMTLTDIGPYAAAFAESRRMLQDAAPPEAPAPGYAQPYGPDMVGVRLGMGLPEAEAVIRKHMTVGRVLRAARGSARLFMSEDERELIAVLDEPDAAPGRVVAAWRQLYAPLSASSDTVVARLREKYGEPVFDQAGAPMLWGPAGDAGCVEAYLAGLETRSQLQAAWLDDGGPLRWRTKNGNASPASPSLLGRPASLQVCGPWVSMNFMPAAGTPAMNLIETTLSDLTRPPKAAAERRASPAVAPRVKF